MEEEVKEALKIPGSKARHRYFCPDEYIINIDGVLMTEDGYDYSDSPMLKEEGWKLLNSIHTPEPDEDDFSGLDPEERGYAYNDFHGFTNKED